MRVCGYPAQHGNPPNPTPFKRSRPGRDFRDYTPQDAPGPEQEAASRSRLSIGGGGRGPAGSPAPALDLLPLGWRPSASRVMRADQASSWYRRMSGLYAVGAWTTLGSLIYLGRKKSKPPGTTLRRPSAGLSRGAVTEAASLRCKPRVYSAKLVGTAAGSSSL